jgi:hypothetical protein
MIRASELISAEALRRYDDNGEPVYTTTERILLTLRWFGWISSEGLREALGLLDADEDTRTRFKNALGRLVKRGIVLCRGEHAGKQGNHGGNQEYRLNALSPELPIKDAPTMAKWRAA